MSTDATTPGAVPLDGAVRPLVRLPLGAVRYLYAKWVTNPRNERKADMVRILDRRYGNDSHFLSDVAGEWRRIGG
jgi:hypothetical protein